jgi:hypothetical protein
MKVKMPVYIEATITKCIGEIEIENPSEFEDAAYELWKSKDYCGFSIYHNNDFDASDPEIFDKDVEEDFKHYKKHQS